MQIVIEISEDDYKEVKEDTYSGTPFENRVFSAIANGTSIPNNATNGDVIKAMFGVKEVDMSNTYCVHFPEEEDYSHYFFKDWWNAPYQKGSNAERNENTRRGNYIL